MMHRRTFLTLASTTLAVPSFARGAATAASGGKASPHEAAWEAFAKRFVTSDGRVVDNGNAGITHTEGLGVALLAAQACDDRERFDRVLTFTAGLRRSDGLFSWKWVAGKGVADQNNATDGDLYIAWALMRAGVRWRDSNLVQQSADLAKAIRAHLVVKTRGGSVLLPGRDGFIVKTPAGGDVAVVNPAYFVLPAMRELQAVDSPSAWQQLHTNALTLLDTARFGPEGLPADWIQLTDPVVPWQDRPARFGYEAIRIPLFLAWAQKAQHPAMRAMAAHFQKPGFAAWVSLEGAEKADYAAPVGFEAVARLVRKTVYGEPFVLPSVDTDYFSSSLVLLSALAATEAGLF